MFVASEYELLDFGRGRKLERFGPVILDRPAPAAEDIEFVRPELWNKAVARFEISAGKTSNSKRGHWLSRSTVPNTWIIHHGEIQFELKLTPFGHVGVFPEQAENWDWIATKSQSVSLRILNLFAYTGGSTLAAASAGTEITHVDAARNMVTWARQNAELCNLSAAPIRWIVDDALKFARRELKRGRRYNAVILDPPSYGHGSRGEAWKLDEQLPELLTVCRELTKSNPGFILLTCHAPKYDAGQLAESLATAGFAPDGSQIESDELLLTTAQGRKLNAGAFARVATIC